MEFDRLAGEASRRRASSLKSAHVAQLATQTESLDLNVVSSHLASFVAIEWIAAPNKPTLDSGRPGAREQGQYACLPCLYARHRSRRDFSSLLARQDAILRNCPLRGGSIVTCSISPRSSARNSPIRHSASRSSVACSRRHLAHFNNRQSPSRVLGWQGVWSAGGVESWRICPSPVSRAKTASEERLRPTTTDAAGNGAIVPILRGPATLKTAFRRLSY